MDSGVTDSPSVCAWHVVIQNYNREYLFHEEADYQHCLSTIKKCIDQYGCCVYAYVLMPDHIQLLVSSSWSEAVTICTRELLDTYADYFNFTYRRIQQKLDPGFSSVPVPDEHDLLTYCRYIELVPVRVQLANNPDDYPWSSFASHALGEDIGLVTHDTGYLALGNNDQIRRSRYRDLFCTHRYASGHAVDA